MTDISNDRSIAGEHPIDAIPLIWCHLIGPKKAGKTYLALAMSGSFASDKLAEIQIVSPALMSQFKRCVPGDGASLQVSVEWPEPTEPILHTIGKNNEVKDNDFAHELKRVMGAEPPSGMEKVEMFVVKRKREDAKGMAREYYLAVVSHASEDLQTPSGGISAKAIVERVKERFGKLCIFVPVFDSLTVTHYVTRKAILGAMALWQENGHNRVSFREAQQESLRIVCGPFDVDEDKTKLDRLLADFEMNVRRRVPDANYTDAVVRYNLHNKEFHIEGVPEILQQVLLDAINDVAARLSLTEAMANLIQSAAKDGRDDSYTPPTILTKGDIPEPISGLTVSDLITEATRKLRVEDRNRLVLVGSVVIDLNTYPAKPKNINHAAGKTAIEVIDHALKQVWANEDAKGVKKDEDMRLKELEQRLAEQAERDKDSLAQQSQFRLRLAWASVVGLVGLPLVGFLLWSIGVLNSTFAILGWSVAFLAEMAYAVNLFQNWRWLGRFRTKRE